MKKLALLLVLAAAACSKSKEAAPTTGSGSAAAAPIAIPPYTPAADTPKPILDAVTAADRSPEDRALDAGRKPAEIFAYFKIAPGQKVEELFAGGGYTTELLRRVVGESGKVYSQNTHEIMEKFAKKPFEARAAKPVMAGVIPVERPIDDPFTPDAKDLDAVVIFLTYHDTIAMKADRPKMNKAVFDALKPGGIYAVVDHSAAAGSGLRDCSTLHRIDEDVVKQEVLAAGFQLDGESDLLRNPADKRDWNDSPRQAAEKRGTSDRFVLRFVKPTK